MARLSSKLVLAVVASSLFLPTLLAQEKNVDGNPPKDQKPGDDKPKEGPPRDDTPKDTPPKGDTPRPRRGGTNAVQVGLPALSINQAGICVGNYVTNGDFENFTPYPQGSDNNIQFANGWSGIWQNGSTADLSPVPIWIDKAPGQVGGFWVTNQSLSVFYREGALNKLDKPIQKISGNFTLSFTSATLETSKVIKFQKADGNIGIYAVYLPSTQTRPAGVSGINSPTNLDLFGTGQVVKLGTATVPNVPTTKPGPVLPWKMNRYEIHFSSSSLSPATFSEMTHLMITSDFNAPSTSGFVNYVLVDDFCLTKDNP
jgi:hypothetical protein